jgi:hypothetical protein
LNHGGISRKKAQRREKELLPGINTNGPRSEKQKAKERFDESKRWVKN